MTVNNTASHPALMLNAGLDRTLAWNEGGSVRYLVAELSAQGQDAGRKQPPALNLALAIDVSGSMAGEKIEAARRAAAAVVEALTTRDRLSIVAFDDSAELLLDATAMNAAGKKAARAAIGSLRDRGQTNLFNGWLLAAERVAVAMLANSQASHRVLLLSDGQANLGITDRREIARHSGALLERGVVTSALGIGDGYDEELLGALAEAGGGNLHDAGKAAETSEVVLGELHEGRAALLERVSLSLSVPANVRAELVGSWAHTAAPGVLEVLVGNLQPDQTKRVVFRLNFPSGDAGTPILFGVSATGSMPESDLAIRAEPAEVELRLARGSENNAQRRDQERSLAVVRAWQSEVLRRAVAMNRDGDRRAAKHFLNRELRFMEPYARGVLGAETLVAELVLVQRRINEEWDERTRKEVFAMSYKLNRSESNFRVDALKSLSERFGPSPDQPGS